MKKKAVHDPMKDERHIPSGHPDVPNHVLMSMAMSKIVPKDITGARERPTNAHQNHQSHCMPRETLAVNGTRNTFVTTVENIVAGLTS